MVRVGFLPVSSLPGFYFWLLGPVRLGLGFSSEVLFRFGRSFLTFLFVSGRVVWVRGRPRFVPGWEVGLSAGEQETAVCLLDSPLAGVVLGGVPGSSVGNRVYVEAMVTGFSVGSVLLREVMGRVCAGSHKGWFARFVGSGVQSPLSGVAGRFLVSGEAFVSFLGEFDGDREALLGYLGEDVDLGVLLGWCEGAGVAGLWDGWFGDVEGVLGSDVREAGVRAGESILAGLKVVEVKEGERSLREKELWEAGVRERVCSEGGKHVWVCECCGARKT